MSSTTKQAPRPWWREPWPWILMAGPFLTLIGCAITIVIAIKYFSDEPIVAGAQKRGLVIEYENNRGIDEKPLDTPAQSPQQEGS
ncbi:MAG TPA: nitrogen fixation protein FixH [Burkholderiaceae bacterium]|nr:nitrogen fixation protein FixH [Burkholderiaceae bacterium]